MGFNPEREPGMACEVFAALRVNCPRRSASVNGVVECVNCEMLGMSHGDAGGGKAIRAPMVNSRRPLSFPRHAQHTVGGVRMWSGPSPVL